MAKKKAVISQEASAVDYQSVLASNPNRDSLFVCKETGDWYWFEEAASNNCKHGYDTYTKDTNNIK